MNRNELSGALACLQRNSARVGMLTLLAVSPAMLTSCYGHFPLTRAVYRINGDVSDNGVIQSIITWIFVLLPVYWFASVIDFFVMNLIEFWSGDKIDISSGTDAQGNKVTLAPSADGQQATLTVERDGKTIQQGQFVRASNGDWLIVDGAGKTQGRVVNMADGSMEIRGASGTVLKTIPADAVKQARDHAKAVSATAGDSASAQKAELAPIF